MTRYSLAIASAYFFLTAAAGFWLPVLSRVLEAQGWGSWIVWVFVMPPLASFLSPLVVSAQADQRFSAEKVLTTLLACSAVVQFLAFRELHVGNRPGWFLALFGINSLISAPAFGLLNTITLTHLKSQTNRFGFFRLWGTVGWIVAGGIVSGLAIDASPIVGYFSVGSRILALICCQFLPATPPLVSKPMSIYSKLGLSSLNLITSRDIGTVLLTSCLFMIPLVAFYMHSSLFLDDLGVERIAVTMTIGQLTEVIALLMMGYLLSHINPRKIFVAGIVCGILRYALFAVGAMTGSTGLVILGIALHGFCWTFFFEAARPFLDQKAPPEMRAQAQALLVLGSSGVGSVGGTLIVGQLHHQIITSDIESWSAYWILLTLMCLLCLAGFLLRFRDTRQEES